VGEGIKTAAICLVIYCPVEEESFEWMDLGLR